jgi:hypothetical protein
MPQNRFCQIDKYCKRKTHKYLQYREQKIAHKFLVFFSFEKEIYFVIEYLDIIEKIHMKNDNIIAKNISIYILFLANIKSYTWKKKRFSHMEGKEI